MTDSLIQVESAKPDFRLAGLLFALSVLSVVLEGLSLEFAGLTIRMPYVVVPLVWLAIMGYALKSRQPIVLTLGGVVLIVWLFFLVISSVISPIPQRSLIVHAGHLSLFVVMSVAIPNLIRSDMDGVAALRQFAFIAGAVLSVGLLLYGWHVVSNVVVPGIRLGYDECPVASIAGTFIESNLYGQFAVITFVLALGLVGRAYFAREDHTSGWQWVLLGVAALAILLSLARNPWVVTVLAVPLMLLLVGSIERRALQSLINGGTIAFFVGILFIGSLFLLPSSFGPVCRGWHLVRVVANRLGAGELVEDIPAYQRVIALDGQPLAGESDGEPGSESNRVPSSEEIVAAGGSSVYGRVAYADGSQAIWQMRPVTGWGLLAAEAFFPPECWWGNRLVCETALGNDHASHEESPSTGWSYSIQLSLLVNGGVISLLLYLALIAMLVWQAWAGFRYGKPGMRQICASFIVIIFSLLLMYQTSQAMWSVMSYFMFGFIDAICGRSISARKVYLGRFIAIQLPVGDTHA